MLHSTTRSVWLFWIVALLVIGAGLGLRDPWPSDEPRFALVAKQMVDSGDWLFPHRGDELYSDKPPMFMWAQAASYLLVRDWRIAFLLPSLLASLGTLWLVYDLGRRLWTPRVGLYAAWALLLTLHFTGQAKKAQIDPLLTFWITLANYGLLRHLLRGPDWTWWWLGWFAAGLGTITKAVGFLTLGMLLPAAFAAWRGWPGIGLHARGAGGRTPLERMKFWLAPLAFAAAVSLWLAPMLFAALARHAPEFDAYVADILFRQTAQRYVDSWQHEQPWWYFAQVIATRWMPLVLLLPWAVPAWRRRLRRRDPRYLLPLAWWLLVVLFFSVPPGKRDVYVLPALPMVCLAIAPLLPGLMRRRALQWLALGFVLLMSLLLLGMAAAVSIPGSALQARLAAERAFDAYGLLAAVLCALAALGLVAAFAFGRRRAFAALAVLLGGLWIGYGLAGYPVLNEATSGRALMREVAARLPADAELGLVAWREQLALHADRPVATFGFDLAWDRQLVRARDWQAQAPGRRWLLVEERALSECTDRRAARLAGINNKRRWWLVPAHALRRDCTPAPHPVEVDAPRLDD
ncbi:MAG TPA: glycosyltransferase family 39 protein [Xanthomonadaceae bacterium]|nr:glycosyltransferase family 39 protein [Xanthomonadaceae bacterium]